MDGPDGPTPDAITRPEANREGSGGAAHAHGGAAIKLKHVARAAPVARDLQTSAAADERAQCARRDVRVRSDDRRGRTAGGRDHKGGSGGPSSQNTLPHPP